MATGSPEVLPMAVFDSRERGRGCGDRIAADDKSSGRRPRSPGFHTRRRPASGSAVSLNPSGTANEIPTFASETLGGGQREHTGEPSRDTDVPSGHSCVKWARNRLYRTLQHIAIHKSSKTERY